MPYRSHLVTQQDFSAITNRSISLLFLDVCSVILLIVNFAFDWRSFSPVVANLNINVFRDSVTALGALFDRPASLSNTTCENFLPFARCLACRKGNRAFAISKSGSRSGRISSVTVVEQGGERSYSDSSATVTSFLPPFAFVLAPLLLRPFIVAAAPP